MEPTGRSFYGEVSSADASGLGVAFTLYDVDGGTAFDLAATEIMYITDVMLVAAAGGAIGIYTTTDAAGKRVVKGTVVANGGMLMSFRTARRIAKGVTPKVIAPAGQVDAIVHGWIAKG